MKKIQISCDMCGKMLFRYPSQIHKHNFCCRACLSAYSSKSKNPEGYDKLKDLTGVSEHMRRLNGALNPVRMTFEVREKLRYAHFGTGEGKTYTKLYGQPEHRAVAARMLGRALRKGEVVHHVDGDKRNNAPENLRVFSSQAEHAAWHAAHGEKRGDAK